MYDNENECYISIRVHKFKYVKFKEWWNDEMREVLFEFSSIKNEQSEM